MRGTIVKIAFGILFIVIPLAYSEANIFIKFLSVFIAGILTGSAISDFTWTCPVCHTFVLPGSRFCPKCGEELERHT